MIEVEVFVVVHNLEFTYNPYSEINSTLIVIAGTEHDVL